jgi:hypothetical protein
LVDDQGELTLTIDYDLANHTASLEACAILLDNTLQGEIAVAYVSLCDLDFACFDSLFLANLTHCYVTAGTFARRGFSLDWSVTKH